MNSGTPNPTFYDVGYINAVAYYHYWNGSNWISTGHTVTANGAANIGGCPGRLYSYSFNQGQGLIYAYDGTGPGKLIMTTTMAAVADIVADCNCNFYLLNSNEIRMYSPSANQVCSWSVTGISSSSLSGGGFAINGNTVYNGYYQGVFSGAQVNFSVVQTSNILGPDNASCPGPCSTIPGTAATNGTLSCLVPTVGLMATATSTNSNLTYWWSGPGIVGSISQSAATASAAGVYTCVIGEVNCNAPMFGAKATLTTLVTFNPSCLDIFTNSITCATLGSAVATCSVGLGPYSYTWLPGSQTGSVVSGLSPGTYTVQLYDQGLNRTYSTVTVFNSPVPLTGQLNNQTSLPCFSAATGTASYTNLQGGSANQTYTWTNGTQTSSAISPTNLTAGVWTATVRDALTGCQIQDIFFISQPFSQNISITSSSPTTCVNSAASFTGSSSGGNGGPYSFNWSFSASGSSASTTETLAGNYVYALTAYDASNCPQSQTIALQVIGTPTLAIVNTSICPLQTGTVSVSGAVNYTWSSSATGPQLSDNPTVTTVYTVTGEALGCLSTSTATITLKPVPIAVLNSNSPLCQGQTLNLFGVGGNTYLWNGPNSFSSAANNPVLASAQPSLSGTYNVTVTALNGCTASASSSIDVRPLPTLTLSASQNSICLNTNSSTITAFGTGNSFNWSPATGLSSLNQSQCTASPTASTTYTIISFLNGCSVSQTIGISVVNPPQLNVTLSSTSLCAQALNGSPNTITMTSSGANTYTLETPPSLTSIGSPPQNTMSTMPPYGPGVNTATLHGSNGVCEVSMQLSFTIIPNPTVSVANPTPFICAGQSYTYTSQGASSFTWSSATPGSTLLTYPGMAVADPSITSVFAVYGGSLGCYSATKTVTLTVNPLPVFKALPDKANVCTGSSTTLTVKGTASNYAWSPPAFLSSMNGSSVTCTPKSNQTYTVIGTLNSCTSSAIVNVSTLSLPIPQISSTLYSLCVGSTFTLTSVTPGLKYLEWLLADQSQIRQEEPMVITANATNLSGKYFLTATDTNGCTGTGSTDITVWPLPFGYVSTSSFSACVPFERTFSFVQTSNTAPVTQMSWYGMGRNYPKDFSQSFTTPGTYTFTGRMTDLNNCSNSVDFIVDAYLKPTAAFDFQPKTPVEGIDEVIMTNTSTNYKTIKWYLADGETQSQTSKENTGYIYPNAGNYPITLIAEDEHHCADTVIQVVNVKPDFVVYIPNSFTPNRDGKNELFYPVLRSVKNYRFMIFDRWGNKVFDSTNPLEGWDGTYKGQDCKQDEYSWKLLITSQQQEGKEMQGHVLLYR